MQALVYSGPEQLTVQSRPEPDLASGGAIVRVLACGICGTDLRIAKGAHRAYPSGTRRVPGHEIAAEIVALDDTSGDLRAGDRIFIAPNLGCGRCAACHAGRANLCERTEAFGITFDGAFEELMAVPAAAISQGNLLPVPADTDPVGLSVVEPLACVLRGQRAVDLAAGDSVVICGAGPIGLLHVLLARANGASTIIVSEPHPQRRGEALEFGADQVVDPSDEDLAGHVRALTNGLGADVVITAVPVAAVLELAPELAAIGGRINFFGGLPRDASRVSIDSSLVHYRELKITGTTANDLDDCRAALDLSLRGELDLGRLVTARYPLSAAEEAFAAAAGGRQLKVVIEP